MAVIQSLPFFGLLKEMGEHTVNTSLHLPACFPLFICLPLYPFSSSLLLTDVNMSRGLSTEIIINNKL